MEKAFRSKVARFSMVVLLEIFHGFNEARMNSYANHERTILWQMESFFRLLNRFDPLEILID